MLYLVSVDERIARTSSCLAFILLPYRLQCKPNRAQHCSSTENSVCGDSTAITSAVEDSVRPKPLPYRMRARHRLILYSLWVIKVAGVMHILQFSSSGSGGGDGSTGNEQKTKRRRGKYNIKRTVVKCASATLVDECAFRWSDSRKRPAPLPSSRRLARQNPNESDSNEKIDARKIQNRKYIYSKMWSNL